MSRERDILQATFTRLQREAAPGGGEAKAPIVVAYGAGVDSTAMVIAMLDAGLIPDAVLFADTGSEKPATYAYLELFRAWLAERGVELVVVRYEPKNFKNYPPYKSLSENVLSNGTLPSVSFGRHSCSLKWKIAPQNKWTEGWAPAQAVWAAGGRVIKLIGYDAGKADSRRYAHAEGFEDGRFTYGYPLRDLGYEREDCEARIRDSGLEVPVKSACFMCAASRPWELHELPAEQLRLIVLMEARARPRLQKIEGLWRNGVKGTRGGEARSGRMTDYIVAKGLLPAAEVDEIQRAAPEDLVRFQQSQADVPIEDRAELASWVRVFQMRDAGAFGGAGTARLYGSVAEPEAEFDHGARRYASFPVQLVKPLCGKDGAPTGTWSVEELPAQGMPRELVSFPASLNGGSIGAVTAARDLARSGEKGGR